MTKSHFEILGVSPDAGIMVVGHAYRTKHHADHEEGIQTHLVYRGSGKGERHDNDFRKHSKVQEALQRTRDASAAVESVANILARSLETEHTINWDSFKKKEVEFSKPPPERPSTIPYHVRPERGDSGMPYQDALRDWEKSNRSVDEYNSWYQADYRKKEEDWAAEQEEFRSVVAKRHSRIDRDKSRYMRKVPDAVSSYCETVLSNSDYPDCFPKDFELDYSDESETLVVNYALPTIEHMPQIKGVKYVQSSDELVEVALAESAINKLYDSAIYQTALRTVHEVFDADEAKAIDAVVFNGWVTSIDKATGQEVKACIVSVLARHSEFTTINLANVDPKLCFKKLKGVGSAKLHGLVPVAPILDMSRDDRRFIPSYEVAGDLDESTNIAAMPWQDFEHLIRELFESEFASAGAEVRVTQASRDRGVDAVVFDPDPVRGGTIVIQAKRYTNTVDVSAVRELHGTVLNEGAMKGILVTTADYGADAYEYAKDKPLTLLNGSNLLHLLEKHGHRATIDLKAAKKLLAEQESRSP